MKPEKLGSCTLHHCPLYQLPAGCWRGAGRTNPSLWEINETRRNPSSPNSLNMLLSSPAEVTRTPPSGVCSILFFLPVVWTQTLLWREMQVTCNVGICEYSDIVHLNIKRCYSSKTIKDTFKITPVVVECVVSYFLVTCFVRTLLILRI